MTPEVAATAPAEQVTCRRCKRPLRSASSVAAKIGPRCAAIEAVTEGLSAKQIDKLMQVIVDKGVARGDAGDVYRVANEDGSVVRTAHVNGDCDCEWGQHRKSTETKVCYHVAAARLLAKPVLRPSRRSLAKAA